MNKVIVCSDRTGLLTLPLCRTLSVNGGVLYVNEGEIAEYSEGTPEFFLTDTAFPKSINARNTVILFGADSKKLCLSDLSLFGRVIAAAVFDNAAAKNFCEKRGIPLVTYGMTKDSDIAFSSLSDEAVSLSICRPLPILPAGSTEPCEITVLHDGRIKPEILLPVCSVLILSGKIKNGCVEV